MKTNQQTEGLLINLDELEESVESIPPSTKKGEDYEVQDLYPEVQLPAEAIEEIMNDEELVPIKEELDFLVASAAAIENKLNNAMKAKMNERKEQLIAQQRAEDEEAVMQGMSNQDTLRAMAIVSELMQIPGMAGTVLEALEALKNGGAPASVMQRITSSLIPSVEPHFMTAEVLEQPAPNKHTAESESKPFKSTKWKPGS